MAHQQLHRLSDPVDVRRDHVLGNLQAPITLLEYGSYACRYCHAAHEVIANLRDHFGDRMRYVFRHLPIAGDDIAEVAADLAEYAHETRDNFWEVHDALMKAGPVFDPDDLVATGQSFDIPDRDAAHEEHWQRAEARVRSNIESARYSGAHVTPTFFINGRRYEGPWDESSLSEAMLGSLGHRVHAAALDFARWAPSTGLLLLVMVILAVIIANTGAGPAFENFWQMPFGMMAGDGAFAMPLREWINDALLTIFFLVVGLEIKREFTIGRLASFQAGALPVAAALGGMTVPALTYLLITFDSPFVHGWGIPIATDTAFAIALIAVLGRRVPVELRVFLTAAAIVDDLAVIVIIAIFYSGDLQWLYLIAALAATGLLAALNHAGVYRALPYALTGLALWIFLHSAGVHATLAGVILALFTPTRPPANLTALLSQAEAVLKTEMRLAGDKVLRHGPSEPALRSLDAIHDRIESPADKLLRSIEPWSSYVVLPLFAFANAGVVMSVSVLSGHELLMLGIVLGLIIGKPAGIVLAAWLAVRLGIAVKPAAYTWQQMIGAGALAGIGFTMSLFIAGQAFADASAFAAAKIAIFIASMTAAVIGTLLVLRKPAITDDATSTTAAQPP